MAYVPTQIQVMSIRRLEAMADICLRHMVPSETLGPEVVAQESTFQNLYAQQGAPGLASMSLLFLGIPTQSGCDLCPWWPLVLQNDEFDLFVSVLCAAFTRQLLF
jgi:hypothetical protein